MYRCLYCLSNTRGMATIAGNLDLLLAFLALPCSSVKWKRQANNMVAAWRLDGGETVRPESARENRVRRIGRSDTDDDCCGCKATHERSGQTKERNPISLTYFFGVHRDIHHSILTVSDTYRGRRPPQVYSQYQEQGSEERTACFLASLSPGVHWWCISGGSQILNRRTEGSGIGPFPKLLSIASPSLFRRVVGDNRRRYLEPPHYNILSPGPRILELGDGRLWKV
ncbi:hypothetical protein QBC43DRAFT_309506 [Cladorrhinum sp. PSN259]|nr:hypothetical protein QBC43DRAFT_309506 [Cladorrhinum sp. PSN259]